jgi:hypothetical protein
METDVEGEAEEEGSKKSKSISEVGDGGGWMDAGEGGEERGERRGGRVELGVENLRVDGSTETEYG